MMKERLSNQRLMREIEQLRAEHAREVESIVSNNKNIYDKYLVYKEQF
jgi:ubiquitin-protein ligase